MNVFDSLITSKIKIKILTRLFLNPAQKTYLRELANEFEISPSQVSTEMSLLIDDYAGGLIPGTSISCSSEISINPPCSSW